MRTASCTIHNPPLKGAYQQRDNPLNQCMLQWRQGQLLVKFGQDFKQLPLHSLECEQRLVQCLKNSPVRLVRLDPRLGEAALERWANACEQAQKPAFLLQGTVTTKLPKKPGQFAGSVMRIIDWIAALLLLIGLSPVMLAVMVLLYSYSPKTIFSRRWQIGLRGKFFRAITFHISQSNNRSYPTQLGRWVRKYRLDEIPLLLNVLRGEISLLGSRPFTLSEAVRLGSPDQHHLQVLPWSRTVSKAVAEV
jgi:hypothetical protein